LSQLGHEPHALHGFIIPISEAMSASYRLVETRLDRQAAGHSDHRPADVPKRQGPGSLRRYADPASRCSAPASAAC